MLILPIHSPVLETGSDVAAIIAAGGVKAGDIVVVSSKAVATAEGARIGLSSLHPSAEAKGFAASTGMPADFTEATLQEALRLHGRVVGYCPGALLTEVRPEGLQEGVILAANAGMDRSNTPAGTAVGWPHDPVASIVQLQADVTRLAGISPASIAFILSDSCCAVRRSGVWAYALTICGIEPIPSQIGSADLFGRPLSMTKEARADQLAVAANIVMGNAAQACPAAIIRDHGLPFCEWSGWVPGIEPERDLFSGILS